MGIGDGQPKNEDRSEQMAHAGSPGRGSLIAENDEAR